jgi:hypothetical protein
MASNVAAEAAAEVCAAEDPYPPLSFPPIIYKNIKST